MLYIGNRPTLKNPSEKRIEVNIFDFDDDLYDKTIQIEFIDFIRHDAKLSGLEALQMQLAQDKIDALQKINSLQSNLTE
jgi:riboflavin kinase/FMN adenylyltransferase